MKLVGKRYGVTMKKYILLIILIILLILSCTKNSPTGPSSPSADDMHWTKSQSPIYIKDCFVVPKGDTLVIDPGVEVIFKSSDWVYDFYINDLKVGMLHIKGKLLAEGTEEEPITFAREDDKGGSFWGGIFIDSTLTEQNRLQYCNIEYSFKSTYDNMRGALSFYCSEGIIDNCYFLNCSSSDICCLENTNVDIYNCTIDSYISWGGKLAIYCSNNSICKIVGNTLLGPEYGIKCSDHSEVMISENIIKNYYYYGICCNNYNGANIEIRNNIIEHCETGIKCHWTGSPNILNNIIKNNWNYGIYSICSNPYITSNLIIENDNGIYIQSNTPSLIVNNTIANNNSGFLCYDGSSILINSVLWDNDEAYVFMTDQNDVYISYSLIQGISLPSQVHNEGNNLMNQDPLFVDETNGNYELQDGSPCINAGNDEVENLPETDILGNPRFSGTSIDMGAYEFQE